MFSNNSYVFLSAKAREKKGKSHKQFSHYKCQKHLLTTSALSLLTADGWHSPWEHFLLTPVSGENWLLKPVCQMQTFFWGTTK